MLSTFVNLSVNSAKSRRMSGWRLTVVVGLILCLVAFSLCTGFTCGKKSDKDTVVASSAPASYSFTKYAGNPVFQPAEWCPWDCSGPYNLSVIFDTYDNLYKMWYLADGPGGSRFGYATSTDDTSWVKYPNNPLMSIPLPIEPTKVEGLSVIKDGSTYKMWYGVKDVGPNGEAVIYYATSSDGITWASPNPDASPYPVLVLTDTAYTDYYLENLSVLLDGTTYRLWYEVLTLGSGYETYSATSSDGLAWSVPNSCSLTNVLMRSNVVKDATIYKMWGFDTAFKLFTSTNGTIWTSEPFYFIGVLTHYAIIPGYTMWYLNRSAIFHEHSTDGIMWKREPLPRGTVLMTFTSSANAESHGLSVGTIIKDDTLYKMWYEYAGHNEISYFGYATSTDGTSWIRSTTNPVLSSTAGTWDEDEIFNSVVIKDGTTYKMWYYGSSITATGIGYATSTDGVTWTNYGSGPVVSDTGKSGFSVVKGPDGKYHLWYGGGDIFYGVSTNGVDWTLAYGPAVWRGTPGSWDAWIDCPTVILDGTTYRMWYIGTSANGVVTMGEATSSDGINWTKLGPVLSTGGAGSWDSDYLYLGCALKDGTTYKIWYIGKNNKGFQRIGLATR